MGVDERMELWWEFQVSEDRRFLEANLLTLRDGPGVETINGDKLKGLRPAVNNDIAAAAIEKLQNLVYLSATRGIQSDVFPVPEESDLEMGNVGSIGQYASWWLHHQEDAAVPPQRRYGTNDENVTLRYQLNAWASHLFNQAELNSVPIPKTNLMRLELKTGVTSDWSRPANNGFGVSYAFPILLAGLVSPIDQTIIIDSPEAHLHPQGQSRMGAFLAKMAAGGVQLLVETHSDHLLNGVRIAIRDKFISPEDVAIYFFTGKEEARVVKLSVSGAGDISDWPDGFFDQSEKDLASLAGWS
jgi:predicted ATPase